MKLPFWFIALALAALLQSANAQSDYKLLKSIPIGGEGGWDILTVDSDAHRLQ